MKKFLMLAILLLSGCTFNVSLSNSSSDSRIKNITDFGYVHFFYEEFNEESHHNFFSNEHLNTRSFSYKKNENDKIGSWFDVDFRDYGVSSFIGGDGIRLTYSGEMWTTSLGPAGDSSIFGELIDIEYYPSEIYEVTLDKEIIEGDQIHIGLNSSLDTFNLENYYVISKDENGDYIKKEISDYENGYVFYYAFNTLMTNPHKYSFLYDFKVR